MSIFPFDSIISSLWGKLEDYIKSKKASENDLRELQKRLQEAMKAAHDSAIRSLRYLPALITTIKVNTCAVELKTTLSHPVRISGNPHNMERHYYSGVRMSMSSLRRRLFHVKRDLGKIYDPREEYEGAMNHLNRAFTYHERAQKSFEDNDIKSSLEQLELLENETEELSNYIERKLRAHINPIIETYSLLAK